MDFEGKVIIVTGSSAGIGAATALLFAKLSAKVVLVARSEEKLKEVAKNVEAAKGIKPLIVKADLTIDSEVENVVNETIKHFGQIDVLINNTGAGTLAGIYDGVEAFDKIISLNLRSVYLLTSLAVPYLVKTKGNIVNNSSICAVKPYSELLTYCISKAGLDMFTKCIAKELAPKGIRVNSVNPGTVITEFQDRLGRSQEEIDESTKVEARLSPLGKVAFSEEVADLIIFLASAKAGSITGSTHFIENGYLLK